MSREFPDWVNPWKAAEGNRIYRGTIALAKMKRLVTLLADDSGEVAFEANFTRDELELATISINVKAEVSLLCQASLECFVQKIDRNSILAAIEDAEQQELVPGHYDAILIEAKKVEFLELVQDELILEIPQVPRKPGIDKVRYSTDPDDGLVSPEDEQDRPFAMLQALLQKKRKDSK